MRFSTLAFCLSLFLAVGCGRDVVTQQDAETDAKLSTKIEGYWQIKSVTFSSGKDHDVVTAEFRNFDKGTLTGLKSGDKAWGKEGGYAIKAGDIQFTNDDGTPRKKGTIDTLTDEKLVIQWLQPNGQPVVRGFLKTTYVKVKKETAK